MKDPLVSLYIPLHCKKNSHVINTYQIWGAFLKHFGLAGCHSQ